MVSNLFALSLTEEPGTLITLSGELHMNLWPCGQV